MKKDSCNLYQIPMIFLADIEISNLKFTWNLKRPQIVKTIFKKRNEVEVLTLPDYKTYYKAIVVKTVWYWNKHRHVD